jgi:DnaJ-class molecular chaperone
MMDLKKECPKCKGSGRIRDKDGTVHPCYDCLMNGRMDQHEKDVKDLSKSGIRI